MFVKDGPKTPEEERIAHMPPAPHDPEAVKAAQHAIDEQILHAGETPDDLGSIHNEQPVAEPSATLVAKDAKEEKKSWLDSHPVEELRKHVHPSKDKDELLDIHVGNPLRRITELLEDIKKQKAFSFTLRGSLGIMGVALAFSTFGIFGGSKLLCDKGTQSYIGTVKQLTYTEEGDYPFLTKLSDAYSILIGGRPSEKPTTRLILHLPHPRPRRPSAQLDNHNPSKRTR
jgi:hypothetical protein